MYFHLRRRHIAIATASTFERRREKLESLLAGADGANPSDAGKRESTIASDCSCALKARGSDGVMAKPISGTYQSDKRVDVQGQAMSAICDWRRGRF